MGNHCRGRRSPRTNQCHIVMAVTNDLETDQRVHRSCIALIEAGYSVTLVGRVLPWSRPIERKYETVRMHLIFRRKALFYAEYNIRLFFRLLLAKADGFYSNDTDTLLACFLAARLRRKPLFFDAHEMFPEVPELVGRPSVKRFWEKIEAYVMPKMAHRKDMAAATVCQSIAEIYHDRYGIKMAVVRNVPMMQVPEVGGGEPDCLANLNIEPNTKIILYQGAVNVGRGIEAVMEAMPLLPECHLLIAGIGDKYDDLRICAKELRCNNITFLGRLEPEILRRLTVHADLGLSLLENLGLNYYYSFPNRIADFVQAGVPVLATDFPEIHRIVEEYGIGTLVPPAPYDTATGSSKWPSPSEMASIVRDAISHWNGVAEEERTDRFAAAAADLSWENDKKVLLKAVNTIFHL